MAPNWQEPRVLCPEHLRVQAYFDGEVDAVSAAEIERHLERCAECRELHAQLQRTRQALKSELSYFRVPEPLAARIDRALDHAVSAERSGRSAGTPAPPSGARGPRAARWWPPRALSRPFWTGALSGVGVSALAAAACLVLWLPTLRTDPRIEGLLGAHLRSLMPDHLIDVVSSDRHTVKPWYAGHADVSPAVADFDAQGYTLVGGRADYLDHQRSAVIVYRHGPHIINVFTWAADRQALPAESTRSGYRLLCWRTGDLQYCAVSDTGWDELRDLSGLIQGLK
jgi:anti-sigma factor RsiW